MILDCALTTNSLDQFLAALGDTEHIARPIGGIEGRFGLCICGAKLCAAECLGASEIQGAILFSFRTRNSGTFRIRRKVLRRGLSFVGWASFISITARSAAMLSSDFASGLRCLGFCLSSAIVMAGLEAGG